MTLSLAQQIGLVCADKQGRIEDVHRRTCPGIHFCPDWDFMPVCNDSPEKESCTCTLESEHSVEFKKPYKSIPSQTGEQMTSSWKLPSIKDAMKTLDWAVLQYMDEMTDFDGWAFPLNCFVDEHITKDMAGAICRNLRNRGYVTFERGLFDDSGYPAGSGYAITKAGREYLQSIHNEQVTS